MTLMRFLALVKSSIRSTSYRSSTNRSPPHLVGRGGDPTKNEHDAHTKYNT